MTDSQIKQLIVTGGAADSFMKRGGQKRTRRSTANTSVTTTRKAERQEGGGIMNVIKEAVTATPAPAPASIPASTPSTPSTNTNTNTNTATAPVKVILAGGKHPKDKKVILGHAKVKKISTTNQSPRTRKIAKRIRMSIGGLNKRVTRANHIRGEAKKQSIESVKKTLIEAKLVKADTKAPETMLRQMFTDYMMLKNKAL